MSSTMTSRPVAHDPRRGSATVGVVLAVVVALVLAGCGGGDSGEPEPVRTASGGAEFNASDVEFATDMIQHHAQAMQMVVMAQGRRGLDPELQALMEGIRATQVPEVESMVDWLRAWDREVPETVMDHGNAGHDLSEMTPMEGMADLPGVLSGEELQELVEARGSAFEQRWLTMMIEHHEGAVEMARREVEDGHNPEAVELARRIVDGQTEEIATMEGMLR